MKLQHFFFRFWWSILFILICYAVYVHGMQKKKETFDALKEKQTQLQAQLARNLSEQEDLRTQIDSQSDPAYRELLMMKKLGMVPDGQTKVYFHEDKAQ